MRYEDGYLEYFEFDMNRETPSVMGGLKNEEVTDDNKLD